jgi:hypothetical protein
MQVVAGTAAGDVRAFCLPLPGAILNVPEASGEGSTVSAHSAPPIGSVTATVRDACPACTTGLVITAQGGVCATFAAAMSRRPEHSREEVACWQLTPSAVAEGASASDDPTATDSALQGSIACKEGVTWRLDRVQGVCASSVLNGSAIVCRGLSFVSVSIS